MLKIFNLLIFVLTTAQVRCQILTQLYDDGYHYEKPNISFPDPSTDLNVSVVSFEAKNETVANFTASINITTRVEDDAEWLLWKITYNKSYETIEEDNRRRTICDENVKLINAHNEKYKAGLVTFSLDKNEFCDLTTEEFQSYYTGYVQKTSNNTINEYLPPHYDENYGNVNETNDTELPEYFDWRDYGVLTPVKKQERCNSCWAFCATGVLEAHVAIRTKEPPVGLSEQYLVDCFNDRKSGCREGEFTPEALGYVVKNGIPTEEDYPYIGKTDTDVFECKKDVPKSPVKVFDNRAIKNNEEQYKRIIAKIGPLAASIYAGFYLKQLGKGDNPDDILDVEHCLPSEDTKINHEVVIIGYGENKNGKYWIARNSWGVKWNGGGYFKIARNKNMCRIGEDGVYPIV